MRTHLAPQAIQRGADGRGVVGKVVVDGDVIDRAALTPMGERAQVADSIDALVAQVTAKARPGDHILCMSNGGFGGVHARLLQSLQYK